MAREGRRHPGAGRLRRARLRGQDPGRRASRASARCPTSASASACRWRRIEAARNLCGIDGASSTEFGPTERAGRRPDDRMDAAATSSSSARQGGDLGGTMRLGAYPGELSARHAASPSIYGSNEICERHRHRYEVNTDYRARARGRRACASRACRPTVSCPRRSNTRDHPWFIGVQFHPELKSRPFEPHPLFQSFIAAGCGASRLAPLRPTKPRSNPRGVREC